jgi:glycosyltransferase involved in cell wall biosynthesis
LKIRKILYIGEKYAIHDQRFIESLEQISAVDTYFFREDGTNPEIEFESYKFIVAAPLTESISKIPENTSIPIIGISLAYDLNLGSDSESLSRNIKKCSFIICDCEYIRKKICAEFDYPIERVVVIPFGCDLEVFSWNGIRDFQKPRFLITRNWTELHSNSLILEAMQVLHEGKVDFKCTFLGDGPELENARRRILNSSLESKVEFSGSKSPMEMAQIMQNSNVYISASSSDGSSVSLMEAMANGMVCVVSDFPSNLEWIVDNRTGFLFRNGFSNSLADVLSGILEKTSSELRTIGKMGQEIANARADWKKNKEFFLESILANSETRI